MIVTAKFIGQDGSIGLKHGETYKLLVRIIRGKLVVRIPVVCPYDTFSSFLSNWEIIE